LDDLESVRSGGEPGEGERTAMETNRGRRRGLSRRRVELKADGEEEMALEAAGAIKTCGVVTSQAERGRSSGDAARDCLCSGREELLLERRWGLKREGAVPGSFVAAKAKECRRE
jgi:hypothetical protein